MARNFRNNTKNKYQNNNQNSNDNYACSPYNFIPFPKNYIYRYDSLYDIPNHNNRFGLNKNEHTNNQANDKGESIEKNEELLSGVIDYSIRCHTPLFISDGNEHNPNFFTINDEYVIPGSTLRGKIRTNTEILSNSYPEFIENQKLWFRGLADKSKKIRDEYEELLKEEFQKVRKAKITDFVKAGYLIRTSSNKYEIIKVNEDDYGNTFKQVPEVFLRNKINNNKYHDMFMFKEDTPWGDINDIKQNKGIQRFKKQKEIGRILRDYQNNHYKSYFVDVDYSIDSKNHLLDIKIKDNDEKNCGMLMNSSSMGSKQNHYLIFEKSSERIEVSNDVIDSFSMNVLYQQKNKDNYMPFAYNINSDIDLRNLPKNVKVPVFYKLSEYNNNKFVSAIGFTPYMKLPFKNNVLDGISNRDNKKIDYAEAIYGFTNKEYDNEKKAYKGRVNFENARISTPNDNLKLTKHTKILSNPKITSFQLYLTQDYNDINRLSTYNDDNFELRGYKCYWLKDDIYTDDKHLDERAKNNMNIQTRINALDNKQNNLNLEFESKIYFSNLTKDELGLLLYSIKPFEEGRENIGQGKPFGFGQVEFNINSVKLDKGISNLIQFNNEYIKLNELQIETLKNSYINKFNELNKEYKFGSDKHIQLRDLYISKTTIVKKNKDRFNYMNLKDFKDRNILQTTKQIKDTYYKSNDNLKLPDIQSEFSLNTEKEKIKENFDLVRMSFEYKKEDLKIIKKDILDFIINKKDELINIDKELDKFAVDFEAEILLSDNKDGNRLLLDDLKDFIYNIKKIHQKKLDIILDFETSKKNKDKDIYEFRSNFESYINRYKDDYNNYDWTKNLELILDKKKMELEKNKDFYQEENSVEKNKEKTIEISTKYLDDLIKRLNELVEKFKKKVFKKQLEEANIIMNQIKEHIDQNEKYKNKYNSNREFLQILEAELKEYVDFVNDLKNLTEIKIKEAFNRLQDFDLENSKNNIEVLNSYYKELQEIDNYINKNIEEEKDILLNLEKSNNFNKYLVDMIKKFTKNNRFEYEFVEEIIDELENKQKNLLNELDYRKKQTLTYYADARLISFNETKKRILEELSNLDIAYFQKDMEKIDVEIELLEKDVSSLKSIINISLYQSNLLSQLTNLDNIVNDIRKEKKSKEEGKENYYIKVDNIKDKLDYHDLIYKTNDLISTLNKSISNINKVDINSENYITSTSKLLIISDNKNDEISINPAIASFITVNYILSDNKNINSIIRQNDCVVFNNLDGDSKRDEIVQLINQDRTNAYVYYNDNNKRFFYTDNEIVFTFSNTKVTLYNAIINVLRFRNNNIQGVN